MLVELPLRGRNANRFPTWLTISESSDEAASAAFF